jgi:Aerobic-type carbon monoxide dehydrogenase, small subunit CoxS/CutS homologs
MRCLSVLINGEPILSCLILPIEVEGKAIMTIEGLANSQKHGTDCKPHPLQTAFARQGASQCEILFSGHADDSKGSA